MTHNPSPKCGDDASEEEKEELEAMPEGYGADEFDREHGSSE